MRASAGAVVRASRGRSGLSRDFISCQELEARIQEFQGCIAARQATILACFESGEAGHRKQIATPQTGLGYCQRLYDMKNCEDCRE